MKEPRTTGLFFYGQGRNRTADTRIFSPLLYHLSYLAETMRRKNLARLGKPWE